MASKGYILKVWITFRAKCIEGDLYQSKQTKGTGGGVRLRPSISGLSKKSQLSVKHYIFT